MNIVLQSQDLSVRYAGNIALSGVSIGVHAAKMVGLVGANGAGKTSLVNALAGWSRGRAGRRVVLGISQRARVGPNARIQPRDRGPADGASGRII